jgi:hypothetical protein
MHSLKKHSHKAINYIIIGVIVLFILIASLWYRSLRIAEDQSRSEAQQRLAQKEEKGFTEKKEAYEVEVMYPLFQEEGSDAVNAIIQDIYRTKITNFIEGAKSTFVEAQKYPDAPKVPSYYISSFEVVAQTERYVSLLSTEEFYTLGAVHPAHGRLTFIFDKKTKTLVEPPLLFNTTSDYLKILSTLSKASFDERKKTTTDAPVIDTSSTNNGFDPINSNFSKMLPTPEGLVIYFDEYQIAPYADGPQEVVIPYEKLRDVIDKNGVLGEMIK